MRAIILAAGRGSRLGNLTQERPKALVPLLGRSLLERSVQTLRAGGVGTIGIVAGYRAKDILDWNKKDLVEQVIENPEWETMNMVGTLALALREVPAGDVLVVYSDIFFPSEVVTDMIATRHAIATAYDPDGVGLWSARFTDPLTDIENFRLNSDGTLAAIGGHPDSLNEIEGQYVGITALKRDGRTTLAAYLDNCEQERLARLSMTDVLQELVDKNVEVGAIPVHGPWGEIDNQDDLAFFEQRLRIPS
jgi:choline kinase